MPYVYRPCVRIGPAWDIRRLGRGRRDCCLISLPAACLKVVDGSAEITLERGDYKCPDNACNGEGQQKKRKVTEQVVLHGEQYQALPTFL